jgi:hypothetical protein
MPILVERVQARCVDDRGVAHALADAIDLEVTDAVGLFVVEVAQVRVELLGADGRDAAVAVVNPSAATGAAAKHVDGVGGGQHAHRRDGLAEQRIDEGALAGRELAHDRDRQRTGESLARGDDFFQQLGAVAQGDAEDLVGQLRE